MSSTTLSPPLEELAQKLSNSSLHSSPLPTWTFTPIIHIRSDVFSRFVEFDGRQEPYIEPHFSGLKGSSSEDDFRDLIAARWSEYRAERYLQSSGRSVSSRIPKPETRVNTPVQLFLAHNRIARAQLEIRVYSQLLKTARPALLEEFEEILKQTMSKPDIMSALPDSSVRL